MPPLSHAGHIGKKSSSASQQHLAVSVARRLFKPENCGTGSRLQLMSPFGLIMGHGLMSTFVLIMGHGLMSPLWIDVYIWIDHGHGLMSPFD
ncbi:hypothetical protein CDAR_123291 [Caerostris darwini]|uniref:Uncharacterized protein n=1 Tax=Caerostris darwini TaxID=1538125 RepID=A0AAV4QBZ3_9ARAC|nr:hypothetical protein CDAR_123291 [Caerostris darwini]